MATKLFLRNTQDNGITDAAVAAVIFDMLPTAGSASDTAGASTTASGTEIQYVDHLTLNPVTVAWISGRAPAGGFTLTAADISVWQHESNMNANIGGRFRIYKYSGGTLTELGGGPFNDGVEMNTAAREDTWAANPTDTSFAENDRIVLKLFITNVGTMASGHTGTLTYNAADGTTGDSFFNIAETVTFKDEANAGTMAVTNAADTQSASGKVTVKGVVGEPSLLVDNFTSQGSLDFSSNNSYAQSFQGDGKVLKKVGWRLGRSGGTGNVVAKLYGHSGTFGVNGTPFGLIATSTSSVDITTLGAAAEVQFSFDPVLLVNGASYFVSVEYDGGANSLLTMSRYTSNATTGNPASKTGASNWVNATADYNVRVYSLAVQADTMSASGTVGSSGRTGTIAVTNANDSLSASGKVSAKGTIAASNAADTSAASGKVSVKGTLSATNGGDSPSISGKVSAKGTVAATNAGDSPSIAGKVSTKGAISHTNANDASNISGTVGSGGAVSGTIAVTNAGDSPSLSGKVVARGTMAATNAGDSPALSGKVSVKGSSAATNAADTSAISGKVATTGAIAAQNAGDAGAASGSVATRGQISATGGQDASAFSGTVSLPPVTGSMSAQSFADFMAALGLVGRPQGSGGPDAEIEEERWLKERAKAAKTRYAKPKKKLKDATPAVAGTDTSSSSSVTTKAGAAPVVPKDSPARVAGAETPGSRVAETVSPSLGLETVTSVKVTGVAAPVADESDTREQEDEEAVALAAALLLMDE